MDFLILMKSIGQLQFNQLNQMLYQSQRPIEPSLSYVGYYTNKVTTYLRDCLTKLNMFINSR